MAETKTLAGIRQIVAIHSAKGGVGKSTVAVNLAVGLQRRGLRVGLLDADIHGPSGALMLGNSDWPDPGSDENSIIPLEAYGLKFISMGNLVTKQTPLIWRGAMVHSVINQFFKNVIWGELDVLLVDMPPGTGDAQLSIGQGVPLTGAVVVSTPQELSLADTIRGIKTFQQLNVPLLGMIENMSYFACDDCGERSFPFGDSGAAMLAGELGFPLLGRLPLEAAVCAGGDKGEPFVVSDPDSACGRAMLAIIDQLALALERAQPSRVFDFQWKELDWQERFPEPPTVESTGTGPLRALWQVSRDELGIQWRDGGTDLISVRALRLACPCAACIEEWSGKPLLDANRVPADITLKKIGSVGRYAIHPVFSDGHGSGIYHFDRLRDLAQGKSQQG